MTLYKLTDEYGCTWGGLQWGEGVTHEAKGNASQGLCTDGWIHAYESPDIAVLMNPIHAGFSNPILWEAAGEIGIRDGALKCGCRSLTTTNRLELPEWNSGQRAAFAIYCALAVWQDQEFVIWADNWLSGKDRSEAKAAETAARAVWAAAEAAGAAARAAGAAARASRAAEAAGAAVAAKAAVRAAKAAKAARAAVEAAGAAVAAEAARAAAEASAWAAAMAAAWAAEIDFDIHAFIESAKQWAKEEEDRAKA